MSGLTLYHSPTSPFVRVVMMVLHETGQIADVTLVTAQGTPLDSSRMPLALNPLGRVPVLARPDGPALHDSRVICRYLDARAGGRLYPEGDALWPLLTLEALAHGMLEAGLQMSYDIRLRPEGQRSAALVEGQWAKIDSAVDALEERWISHLGGRVDAGQIAVAAALGYLDLRHDARVWRGQAATLAKWFETFSARPSFLATAPPPGA